MEILWTQNNGNDTVFDVVRYIFYPDPPLKLLKGFSSSSGSFFYSAVVGPEETFIGIHRI